MACLLRCRTEWKRTLSAPQHYRMDFFNRPCLHQSRLALDISHGQHAARQHHPGIFPVRMAQQRMVILFQGFKIFLVRTFDSHTQNAVLGEIA